MNYTNIQFHALFLLLEPCTCVNTQNSKNESIFLNSQKNAHLFHPRNFSFTESNSSIKRSANPLPSLRSSLRYGLSPLRSCVQTSEAATSKAGVESHLSKRVRERVRHFFLSLRPVVVAAAALAGLVPSERLIAARQLFAPASFRL